MERDEYNARLKPVLRTSAQRAVNVDVSVEDLDFGDFEVWQI